MKVADEVVVVDGGSSDATQEVARELGCKVVENPWPGYARQRVVGVEHAAGEWVLFVDADEEVGDDLAASINAELRRTPRWDAFRLTRVDDFMSRRMPPHGQVRLCRRSEARIRNVLVHERIDVAPDHVGSLQGTLWHHGFRGVSEHVLKVNRYTDLEAEQAWEDGRRPSLLRLVGRPPARFVEKYLLRGLVRRGVPGIALSGQWAYYEFLRELKLFERSDR